METINPIEQQAVRALSALAQVQRLRAFRALVVAGPEGLTPGAMAEQLGVSPSALSFHLKELAHADLVSVEPQGRHLIYRAQFDRMNGPAGLPDRTLLRRPALRSRARARLPRLLIPNPHPRRTPP